MGCIVANVSQGEFIGWDLALSANVYRKGTRIDRWKLYLIANCNPKYHGTHFTRSVQPQLRHSNGIIETVSVCAGPLLPHRSSTVCAPNTDGNVEQ